VPLPRPITPLKAPWIDVVRKGTDVLLAAVGPELDLAEEAAVLLDTEGISSTVAGFKRARPLEIETVRKLAAGHRAVVTVEDNALVGGFGSALLEILVDGRISRPVRRVGLPDAFIPHGPVDVLRSDLGLTAPAIASSARAALQDAEGRSK
jgi:1-deoxy-D-xylulose-5-phosphate synthase